MILSRFVLNQDHDQARRDLSNPYEMHRTVKKLVGEETPLWRLEERVVLMQSQTQPNWQALPEDYFAQSPLGRPLPLDRMQLENRNLRFRLRANPVVSYRCDREGRKLARSQRCPVYDEPGQRDWLARQGAKGGFEVVSVEIGENGKLKFKKRRNAPDITVFACFFEGILRVTDLEAFRATLQNGIGPAKAFGMGLLSLGPA